MLKRILCSVVAASLLCALLAGCSNAPSSSSQGTSDPVSSSEPEKETGPYVPEKEVTLEYWFEGAGPERSVLYTTQIDEFNAKAQNIKIEGVYVELTSVKEKLNVAIAAEATPALAYMGDSLQSNIFVQNVCEPLDEYFDAWEEKDAFDPAFLQSIRNKDMDGRLLAIPTAGNESGIWYRSDVYAQKGIDPPDSWDHFWAAAEKGTDPATTTYGLSFTGAAGSANFLQRQIIAYLGEEDYFDAEGTCILRDERATDVVDHYVEIYQKGYAPQSCLTGTYLEMIADFNAEVAMMMVHNLGSYENQSKTFQPDQYVFLPFPASPYTGKYATPMPSAKGIAAFTKTCPDMKAAWEYIKHQCSEPVLSALNSSVGELAPRTDCKVGTHVEAMNKAMAEKGRVLVKVPTYLPDWSSILTTYAEPKFQEVLYGTLSSREYLDAWSEQLEAAEAEYRAQL